MGTGPAAYFYPRPPRGGRLIALQLCAAATQFLSTPSARRATALVVADAGDVPISIHALREEGDPTSSASAATTLYFYPRPPRGGRRRGYGNNRYIYSFLSTPSARRATLVAQCILNAAEFLSTPSARRATRQRRRCPRHPRISIHALREEGDPSLVNSNLDLFLFLSTPSARRATPANEPDAHRHQISIHALREEGDLTPES